MNGSTLASCGATSRPRHRRLTDAAPSGCPPLHPGYEVQRVDQLELHRACVVSEQYGYNCMTPRCFRQTYNVESREVCRPNELLFLIKILPYLFSFSGSQLHVLRVHNTEPHRPHRVRTVDQLYRDKTEPPFPSDNVESKLLQWCPGRCTMCLSFIVETTLFTAAWIMLMTNDIRTAAHAAHYIRFTFPKESRISWRSLKGPTLATDPTYRRTLMHLRTPSTGRPN